MSTPRLRPTSRLLLLAAVGGALAVPATGAARPAGVGIGRVTAARVALGAHRPGRSSGLHVLVNGKLPPADTTEPPAVRQTIVLPRGARVDARGAVRCHATATQLAQLGAEGACPAAARVGTGQARGRLKGAPVAFDVAIYAFPKSLWFAAERGGMPLKQGFTGRLVGTRRLVLDVPTFGGTIAPTRFEATIRAHRRRGHRLITTPPSCPQAGWRLETSSQGLAAVSGPTIGRPQRTVLHERCHG